MQSLAYTYNLVDVADFGLFHFYPTFNMAGRVVIGLLLYGMALADAGPDEALQPCGEAFYYPSKVRAPETFCQTQLNLLVYML